jgi:hypothetical protein
MSFRLPTGPHFSSPSERAKELGVSVDEMKEISHKSRQLCSDFQYKRPTSDEDMAFLMKAASKGGNVAAEILWGFLPLKGSKYDSEIMELALKCAESADDSEAFAAINLLRYHGDKRWESLANAHDWKWPDLRDALFEPIHKSQA